MLDNLDSSEPAMSPLQSGTVISPTHAAVSSLVDIHMPDGRSHCIVFHEQENIDLMVITASALSQYFGCIA